jgi:hypothetical protein
MLASSNESLFRFRGIAPSAVFGRMPRLRGRRIQVSFMPMLTAYRGELLSKSHKGDAVYAGTFLRKRRIILEEQMLRTPRVLERIFVHEVFHFVWSKLGNQLDPWSGASRQASPVDSPKSAAPLSRRLTTVRLSDTYTTQ